LLTRYADILAVYKDPITFSSDKKAEFGPKYGDTPLYEHHTSSLVFNDPPLHTRVRSLILGALTPRAIEGMEPGLVALVDDLLDRLQEKGTVDLVGTSPQPFRSRSLAICSPFRVASEVHCATGRSRF
jgi:cytochrome P450